MSKRYTYYRMPNGNPYRGLDAKYAPLYVLAEIGKTATVNADGTVSWQGFSMQRLKMSLKAAMVVLNVFGDELNETDSWRIVWQGVVFSVKCGPGKPIQPMELTTRVDKLAAEFFRQPRAKYVLVSSLSIIDLPAKKIKIRGCKISSLKTRRTRFPLPEVLTWLENGSAFSKHINSSEYRLVRVTTEGRSKYEAADNALKSLSLLRGLWSLFATYRSWTIRGGSIVPRKPIGVIHTGPIHTLHLPNGTLVDNYSYWYDPDFAEDQSIFQPSRGWQQIEKNRRRAMKQLSTLEYRQDLEMLLIRYVDALDQLNPSIAFLKMWGILERIPDTIGNYDKTINRAIWIFPTENRLIAKDMLQSLRFLRNQYVHSGDSGEESDQVAYMIKSFVDPHLLRLISNPFKFKTIEEYGEFLSLPTDVGTLEQRQRKLKQALRWLRQKNGAS